MALISLWQKSVMIKELGTPGGVTCSVDVECFLYGCGRFVLDDKRAYHHKIDVGLHHKKEKWKLIPHCFVGSSQEGDFVRSYHGFRAHVRSLTFY